MDAFLVDINECWSSCRAVPEVDNGQQPSLSCGDHQSPGTPKRRETHLGKEITKPASKKSRGKAKNPLSSGVKNDIEAAICFVTRQALFARAELTYKHFSNMVGFTLATLPYYRTGVNFQETEFAMAVGQQLNKDHTHELPADALNIITKVKKNKKTKKILKQHAQFLTDITWQPPPTQGSSFQAILPLLLNDKTLSPGDPSHRLAPEIFWYLVRSKYAQAAYAIATLGIPDLTAESLRKLSEAITKPSWYYFFGGLTDIVAKLSKFPDLPPSGPPGSHSLGHAAASQGTPYPSHQSPPAPVTVMVDGSYGSSHDFPFNKEIRKWFGKQCHSPAAARVEFVELMRVSDLKLPEFVPTHIRHGSIIWMDYGGITLDRLRELPDWGKPHQSMQARVFLELMQQGLQGLQVLSDVHGMVHGDVKPLNVVIDRASPEAEWRWRYIDYANISCTWNYVDPDCLTRDSEGWHREIAPDGIADQYALLLTVLEVLLGLPPCLGHLPATAPTVEYVGNFYEKRILGTGRLMAAFLAAHTGPDQQERHDNRRLLEEFKSFASPRSTRKSLEFTHQQTKYFEHCFNSIRQRKTKGS